MNLKECEQQLKDVTEQINMLVRKREEVLLKWQQAFDAAARRLPAYVKKQIRDMRLY